ncbi:MAG TPA: ABC transporter ATP-binding protein [Acidimicrobiales bacterium]
MTSPDTDPAGDDPVDPATTSATGAAGTDPVDPLGVEAPGGDTDGTADADADGRPEPEFVLEARGITKRFPGVLANDGVDLTLRRGEVHCVLGENGAGKSTLMNVIFGLYQPDAGELLVEGEPVRFRSSADAIARGIGMVHQHFQLVQAFTVAENVVLGEELRRGPLLDLDAARRRIRELSESFGLTVDPDARVSDLSVGEQQRVELLKALFRDAEILILDEPTAVLTPGEVDEFFKVVESLTDQGKSIIFITHKLREVLAVADRITVIRRGRVVGTADPGEATPASLASLMVGREILLAVDKTPATPGDTRLRVRDLMVTDDRGYAAVEDLSFEVRAGEIFGLAGVEGNGQRELVEAITGMRPKLAGTVELEGEDITHLNPRQVDHRGVAHVPEDRNKHGLVESFTLADNLVLNTYADKPFARRLVRQTRRIDEQARELVERYDIRTSGIHAPVGTLSGGNQQKVIIARELSGEPKLLIVAQPTRGLDVGSIEFIHRRIIEMRDAGAAVLLVSAELDEIFTLSDRIGVLFRGRLVGDFPREEASRDTVGYLMASGRDPEEAPATDETGGTDEVGDPAGDADDAGTDPTDTDATDAAEATDGPERGDAP